MDKREKERKQSSDRSSHKSLSSSSRSCSSSSSTPSNKDSRRSTPHVSSSSSSRDAKGVSSNKILTSPTSIPPKPSSKESKFSPTPPCKSSSSKSVLSSSLATSLSSPPPTTLAPFQPPPGSCGGEKTAATATWNCKLCSITVQTENAFHNHLTLKHYRERIERRIKPPFRCLNCSYDSPGQMTDKEKTRDLLLHYGLKEKVSVKFYEQECKDKLDSQEKNEKPVNIQRPLSSLICKICKFTVENRILLQKHLTLKHFAKTLYDELPKEKPYKCPHKDCDEIKSDSHKLLLHYGINHKRAMHFYRKETSLVFDSEKSSSRSTSSTKDTAPKVELPETPRLNKLKAVVSPYNPLSDKQKPAVQHASTSRPGSPSSSDSSSTPSMSSPPPTAPSPGPLSPETGGSRSGGSSESSGSMIKVQYLERRIKALQTQQKEKLKEKQSEFERWLAAKESALQQETVKSRLLEEKLAEKESSVADLTTQLEMVHENLSRVEDEMSNKTKLYDDLAKLKEENDRQMEEKESERINSYEELYQKEKELEAVLESMESLKSELSTKSKEAETAESKFTDLQNKYNSLERNSEQVQKESTDKKELLEEVQQKNEEMHTEILLLKSERKNLNKSLADLSAANEKEVADLKEKLKVKEKDVADKTALKAIEKEKKELTKKVKKLESTLSEWETRQFTNVKLISGLEKERDSLQLKLKEMKDGNLSHEDELYWKDVAIKNANKETKALQTKYDALLEEMEDKKKKLADVENQSKINSKNVEELKKLKLQVAGMVSQEEYEEAEKTLTLRDGEIKHLKITLDTKIKNYAKLNTSHQELKEELKKLKIEKNKTDKRCEEYISKITKLDAECEEQKEKMDELKSLCEEHETRVVDLESQCLEYHNKMRTVNQEVSDLKCRLASLDTKKKQRKGEINQENRIELLMMNQVLKDMDTVIKLRDKGVSPEQEFSSTLIQEDSFEGTSCTDSVGSPLTLETEEDQIQYPNSDHSYPLSSPPIVSPEVKPRARKRKSASPQKINKKRASAQSKVKNEDLKSEDDIVDILDEDIENILNAPDVSTSKKGNRSTAPKRNSRSSKVKGKVEQESVKSEDSKGVDTITNKTRGKKVEDKVTVPADTKYQELESGRGRRAAAAKLTNLSESDKSADDIGDQRSGRRMKRENNPATGSDNTSSGNKKKKGKKGQTNSGLVDVTHEYEAEEEGGDYVCGVCGAWDAPEDLVTGGETTEWIGCDCDRWFHKQCTGMKKFTTKFSCKSLKLDCLIIPITMDSVTW